MRVFVTGGTGFVGSHLVLALLEEGAEVACLVRDPAKSARLFGPDRVEIVRGDLADAAALERGCRGAAVVYHVAGLTAARSRADLFATNERGTRTLVDAIARTAPGLGHFVHLSSLAAAGPGTARGRQGPAEPRPVSDYGRSKLAGERVLAESGLPWTVVRPPTVYGPRDREVLKVFKLARLGLAPVFGDGGQANSFVYAPDLARALLACRTPLCVRKTYFACHAEVRTQRELAIAVWRALRAGREHKRPRVLALPPALVRAALHVTGTAAAATRRATLLNADRGRDFLAEAWTCSPEALRADTGWTASTDLDTGLRQTAEWYRQAGWL